MTFTSISRRLAATGAATALATGALVGATATGAEAAATTDYACSVPSLGMPLGTIPVTADAPGLQDLIDEFGPFPAGLPVSPGLLGATSALELPSTVAALLASQGVVGGTMDDFGFTMGDSFAKAPQEVTSVPGAAGGTMTASGVNELFTLPAAGTYDILLPESFSFAPATAAGPLGLTVECVTEAPTSLGQIETTLNESATDAKTAPKKVKKGKRATVTALVSGANTVATGDVVAMKGNKELGRGLLDNGSAKFRLDKLKPGKHKVVVKYLGDAFQTASQDTVTIKVVKPKR